MDLEQLSNCEENSNEQVISNSAKEEIECPFCHEHDLTQIGINSYLCNTCKNKFLDVNGKVPENIPSYEPSLNGAQGKQESLYGELAELKQMLDAGIINQKDYDAKKNQILGLSNNGGGSKHTGLRVFSWFFAICLFLGILVNFVVGLAVWGFMSPMFVCPEYGYTAGLIISGVSLFFCLILLPFLIKSRKDDNSVKAALVAMIVFIILTAILVGISFADYEVMRDVYYNGR